MKEQTDGGVAALTYAEARHPYSPVRPAGMLLFVSGQLGVRNDSVVSGGLAEEFRQALRNLENHLTLASSCLGDVVKTTVYLASMSNRLEMDAIYEEVFADPLPVRTCIGVYELPFGASVEIEAIAYSDHTGTSLPNDDSPEEAP